MWKSLLSGGSIWCPFTFVLINHELPFSPSCLHTTPWFIDCYHRFLAVLPHSSLFQDDKSNVFQVQFQSTSNKFKLELLSLYLRLHILAPTWISSAPGYALLPSATLPSPPPLCPPYCRPHQPSDVLLNLLWPCVPRQELTGECRCLRGSSAHVPKLSSTEWHPCSQALPEVLN